MAMEVPFLGFLSREAHEESIDNWQAPVTTPLDHQGIQASTLRLCFSRAAPSQWLSMLGVLQLTRSCTTRAYSKEQLWLKDCPPAWPRGSQNCSVCEETLPFLSPFMRVRLASWSELSLPNPCPRHHSQVIPPINISHPQLLLSPEDPDSCNCSWNTVPDFFPQLCAKLYPHWSADFWHWTFCSFL